MKTMEEANEFFESAGAREDMRSTYREAIPKLCKQEGCNLPESDLIHHKDIVRQREIAAGMDDEISRTCHDFVA